jgi:ribosome biogenesis GTPase A
MEYICPDEKKIVGPILLTGLPGVGKSHWIHEVAKKNNVGIYSYNCRRDKTLREGRNKLINWVFLKEPCIVWLEGADDLTIEAQSFLRRSLETHSHNVFLVLEVRDTSCMADPLRSRCLTYIIPPPSPQKCMDFLLKQKPQLPEQKCREIIESIPEKELSYRKMLTYHQVQTLFPISLERRYIPTFNNVNIKDILQWRKDALNHNEILQEYIEYKDYTENLHKYMPLASFTHSAWHQLAYLILNE